MAQALLQGPQVMSPAAGETDDNHVSLRSESGIPHQHMSLLDADPAGFYYDSAFFANAPPRVSERSMLHAI